LVVVCFCLNTSALNPHRAISEYIHDRWEPQSEFPNGTIYAITQTPDGYLWLGTEKGLVRFDGFKFQLFDQTKSPELEAGAVIDLLTDAEGNVWIRSLSRNLFRYSHGQFYNDTPKIDPSRWGITAMCRGSNGQPLFNVRTDGIYTFAAGNFSRVTSMADRPSFLVISMAQTEDGKIWLGSRDLGLFSMGEGKVSAVTGRAPDIKINTLLTADGELWIGTDKGLARWNGREMTETALTNSREHLQILSLARDSGSNIWIGTSKGLIRLNTDGVSQAEWTGIAAPEVNAIFEDREKNLWIGTGQGLERLRDRPFMTYSASKASAGEGSGLVFIDSQNRKWIAPSEGGLYCQNGRQITDVKSDGLDLDVVYSLTGNRDEIWVGRQHRGLTRVTLKDGQVATRTYTQADGLVQNSIYTVLQGRDGTVWAGSLGSGVSRFRDGKFTTFTTANGLSSNAITSILESLDGTVWLATANGLSSFSQTGWKGYGGQEGLPPGRINCLFQDSSGVLWLGTDNGLGILQAGRIQIPPQVPPALHEPVLGIALDRFAALWVATSNHILRISKDELLKGAVTETNVREFGLVDGLRSVQSLKRDRAVVMDPNGQIWFSTYRGASVADPAQAANTAVPAIVHIDEIMADGNPLNLQGPIRLRGSRQRITFSYVGLSLSTPERVRFRYKLEPYDRDWSEPRAEREATYTNLDPGSYRFRVMASNSAGVWSAVESTIQLDIEPLFWQTWWFRVSLLMAAVLTIILLYRLRLQRLTRQMNVRFEERLAERTRIAQDLHDTLLQGFLSASMQLHVAAEQVPSDSPAKPLINRVLVLIRTVIDEGRTTLKGLRAKSTDSADLAQSFSRIQDELLTREPIDYRVTVEGPARPLQPVIRDEVYHIGHEALVNAFRHAHASTIEVELEYGSKQLRMLVRDDGRGIDPQVLSAGRDGHWGIPGMRERAEEMGARLKLWSREGAGTEVELSIPGRVAYQVDSSSWRRWFANSNSRKTNHQGRN